MMTAASANGTTVSASAAAQTTDENPFSHHVSLTFNQWVRTIVFGSVLVPLKLAILTFMVLSLWLPYFVIHALFLPSDQPMTIAEQKFFMWFFYIASYVSGIRYKVEGEKVCEVSETRIHISAPHITVFELFLFGLDYRYTSLSKSGVLDWPILGGYFKRKATGDGIIFVDKNCKDSRRKAHEAVANWLDKQDQLDPDPMERRLGIAPEGWYANGKILLPFKTGAFKPGRPVQVTLLIWDRDFNPTVTTWGMNISWFTAMILTLAQTSVHVTIKLLPVYYPSAEERSDAELYAKNVTHLVARELGMPVCKYSAVDMVKEVLQQVRNKHKKMN